MAAVNMLISCMHCQVSSHVVLVHVVCDKIHTKHKMGGNLTVHDRLLIIPNVRILKDWISPEKPRCTPKWGGNLTMHDINMFTAPTLQTTGSDT